MAKVGQNRRKKYPSSVTRVSPIKPGLQGARNWATAQIRAATYSRQNFWRLCNSAGLVLIFILLAGLWLGGYLPQFQKSTQSQFRHALIKAGFTVERIDVVGEGRLHKSDVLAVLDIEAGDYLFEPNLAAAQKRVESLNWVHKALVRRLWPDRIVVEIIEREQYILWQTQGVTQLIDKTGDIIPVSDISPFAHLPLVTGEAALNDLDGLKQIMISADRAGLDVDAYSYLPSARWDIYVNDLNLVIKLPSEDPSAAIHRLQSLNATYALLSRSLSVIDMRLSDRVTLGTQQDQPA